MMVRQLKQMPATLPSHLCILDRSTWLALVLGVINKGYNSLKMATGSLISPPKCHLLEETRVGGISVISAKYFQAISYSQQGQKRAQTHLLSMIYNHQSDKRFCIDKQVWVEHLISVLKMDNADLIRAQGDLTVDYFFEEKFYICVFNYHRMISGSAGKTLHCYIWKRKRLWCEKMAFAEALLYSRPKLCKAVLCTNILLCRFGASEA